MPLASQNRSTKWNFVLWENSIKLLITGKETTNKSFSAIKPRYFTYKKSTKPFFCWSFLTASDEKRESLCRYARASVHSLAVFALDQLTWKPFHPARYNWDGQLKCWHKMALESVPQFLPLIINMNICIKRKLNRLQNSKRMFGWIRPNI